VFKSFGDSALDFSLRLYIAGPWDIIAVRHSLNMAIDQAFREAGIEIAFPQHDIHIRSDQTRTKLSPSPEEPEQTN
jgi:potassium-dependent mechanosensitive channel